MSAEPRPRSPDPRAGAEQGWITYEYDDAIYVGTLCPDCDGEYALIPVVGDLRADDPSEVVVVLTYR